MFNFTEDVGALARRLRDQLGLSAACVGPAAFLELSSAVALPFRGLLRCGRRGPPVTALADIQAHLELTDRSLRDFEQLSRNIFNVAFTLRALGLELSKVHATIEMIYDEISELWTALSSIDKQNRKIIKILTTIWCVLQDLKKGLYVMSRQQKELIERNMYPNTESFSDYFECSDNEELNSLLKSFSSKIMYFSETLRQMKYMNELLRNHQKLKSIHPLFSFQLILMINDPRISLPEKVQKEKCSLGHICPCVKKANQKKLESEGPLLMNPDVVLSRIESQIIHIGDSIYKACLEVKEVHCASLRREKIVLMDIEVKRMVLFRGLNEMQNVMTTLSDIDDGNDTLVGKMTKTRPLFKNINEYLKFDLSQLEPSLEPLLEPKTSDLLDPLLL